MKKRMMMTKVAAFSLAVMLAVPGCGAKQEKPTDVQKEETKEIDQKQGETVMFTDSCGREVELPAQIDRIVPMGPPAQMMLLALAPEKVMGVTQKISEKEAKYLGEECAKLPEFGSFYGAGDLNKEALLAADPQVIIDMGESKNGNKEDLDGLQEQLGIPTIFIESSLETTGEAFRTLGKILGKSEEADKLGTYCETKLDMIKKGMEKIPEDKKKGYLYAGGDNGLWVVSKDSFHAEVLDMLGNNVAVLEEPTRKGTGDEISGEQLLLWNPELVIFAPNSIYNTVKEDELWSQVDAIQNDRYYEVPSAPYNWMGMPPAINRFLGMQWAANILYPDVFDYDMYEVTKEYYNLFYHYDLKEEEFQKLTENAIK